MLADNMILLKKKTKNLPKWLDLIDRAVGYKVNIQKSTVFICIYSELMKRKI